MKTSRLCLAAFWACCSGLPLFAQVAPAASTPADDDQVVGLSPFIINAQSDAGYYTSNAVSGTRVTEKIKNLPLNVSVLSEEFLTDAAIYDVDSILQWTASNTGPTNPRIRGLNSNTRVNGFGGSERDDAISIGRVEVIKGPGAIMSGSSAPGGMVNVLTKRPLGRNRLMLAQVVNDRGFFRTELDANYRASREFGIRVAAARITEDGFSSQRLKQSFYDYEKTETTYYGVVEWRPAARTTITADFTYLTQDRPFRDQPNVRWDTFGRIAPTAGAPTVYLIESPFNYPKSFGLSGPDAIDDIKNTMFDVELVQEFTDDLQLKFVVNGKERSRILVGPASTGLVTANAALVAANPGQNLVVGERYFGVRWNSSEQVNPWGFNYELNLLWKHRLGDLGEGKLLTGGNLSEGKFYSISGLGRSPTTNAEQRYYFRLGDINPNRRRPADLNMVYTARTPTNTTTERNAFIVHQGSFNSAQWHTLAGLFYYDYESVSFTNDVRTVATNEGVNPQVGVVRQLYDWLSVYAVYAKSIQGQSIRNSRGEVLPPFKGTNYEAGFKLDSSDARYSGTVSYFQTDFVNRQFNDPTVPDINGNINPGERVSSGEDRSQGIDSEFIFTPLPGWQLIVGYAYLDTFVKKDRKDQPQRIGQRFNNHSFHNYSLWTRYNFSRDTLKGFSIGGGIRGDSGAIRQYITIDGVPQPAEDTTDPYVELFCAYERMVGRTKFFASLNVKNVTRQSRYFQFEPNSTKPYFVWKDPVEPFLRVGLEF